MRPLGRAWNWTWNRQSRWLARPLAVAGLVVALVPAAVQAQGTGQAGQGIQTWDVQVGGSDEATHTEFNAFFPDPLAVRAGDTVRFGFAGLHTVTFNSNRPALPIFVPGPAPGTLQIGPAFFPIGDPQRATYGGVEQISSGAPLGEGPPEPGAAPPAYSVTFTQPGLYGYVCEIHPGMRGTISVGSTDEALEETPAQATARGQRTLGALKVKAAESVAAVRAPALGPVHTAMAGLQNAFEASVNDFLPRDLTVRRGDYVAWTNPDPAEIHTVTFAAGVPAPEFIQPVPQAAGPPRLVIPAEIASPAGGTTFTGQGLLNSGILFEGQAFVAHFDAPPGTYTYYCAVHGSPEGGMRGTVTVAD